MSEDGFWDRYEDVNTIEIQIKTLMGTMFDVRVLTSATVGDIKKKIYRVEGIPIYQQNLIFQSQELKDLARIDESGIKSGSTLTLVPSMRGGPISTRRLSVPCEHYLLKELKGLLQTTRDDAAPGSKVSVLVFKEGDIINLLRVVENEDGSYSPFNEGPISPPSKPSRRDTLEAFEKLIEDTEMCTKVAKLRKKMEELSVKKQIKTDGGLLGGWESEKSEFSYQFFEECAENLLKEVDLTVFERTAFDEGDHSESEEVALKEKHRGKGVQPLAQANKSLYSETRCSSSYSRMNYTKMANKKRDARLFEKCHDYCETEYKTYSRDRDSSSCLLPQLDRLCSSPEDGVVKSENPYLLEGLNANKLPDMHILDTEDFLMDEARGILGNIGVKEKPKDGGLLKAGKNGPYRPIIPESSSRTALASGLIVPTKTLEDAFMPTSYSKELVRSSYSLASTTSTKLNQSKTNASTSSLPNLASDSRGQSPILGATAKLLDAEEAKVAEDCLYGENWTVPRRNRMHLARLLLASAEAVEKRPNSSPSSESVDRLEERTTRDATWAIQEPASERLKHSATCKVGLLNRRQNVDYMETTTTAHQSKSEVLNLRGRKYSNGGGGGGGPSASTTAKYTVYSGPQVYMPSHLMTPSAIPPEYAPKINEYSPKINEYCERIIFRNNEARSPLYSRKNRTLDKSQAASCSSIERLRNEDSLFSLAKEPYNSEDLFGYYNLGCVQDLFEKEQIDEIKPEVIKLPPVIIKKKSRCNECNKRLNITNIYNCRCGKMFCSQHRYSEVHRCTYDYKTEGRKILERQNPLVTAEKVQRF